MMALAERLVLSLSSVLGGFRSVYRLLLVKLRWFVRSPFVGFVFVVDKAPVVVDICSGKCYLTVLIGFVFVQEARLT